MKVEVRNQNGQGGGRGGRRNISRRRFVGLALPAMGLATLPALEAHDTKSVSWLLLLRQP